MNQSNMNENQKNRPITLYLLLFVLIFQGFSGIYGGLMLMIDPGGTLLNIPVRLLDNTPFSDFLIPGLILFVILGIAPLIAVYPLWKPAGRGWFFALLIGLALIIWISVQILLIGYQADPPLQAVYGSAGLLIILLAVLPSVRKYAG